MNKIRSKIQTLHGNQTIEVKNKVGYKQVEDRIWRVRLGVNWKGENKDAKCLQRKTKK